MLPRCIGNQHSFFKALRPALRLDFTRQQDVNERRVLRACAVAVGLAFDEAAEVLESGMYATEVRAQQQHWLQEGIHAVPCFVVNQQYMVQGAQDAAAFGRMLDKLLVRSVA